jgi:hypothetical protein
MSTVQESIVCVTDSRYKSIIDDLIKTALPILDAEGYAICLEAVWREWEGKRLPKTAKCGLIWILCGILR